MGQTAFTPYKVPKGPEKNVELDGVRFTRGRYVDTGEPFTLTDHWRDAEEAHRQMKRPWIGRTTFFVKTDS